MRRFRVVASVALVVLLLAFPGRATTCEPGRSDAPVVEAAGYKLYLVVDPSLCEGCPVGVHVIVYEETNGIDGLQRSDARKDDTCKGQIRADEQFSPL